MIVCEEGKGKSFHSSHFSPA